MKNRILITLLLPVIAIALAVALWATSAWVPPLLGFMQKRTDASIVLITNLGFEKCENSFNYLLDLRLESDQSMIASLKKETLSEIRNLNDQFDKIQLTVLDSHGHVVLQPDKRSSDPMFVVSDIDISGNIVENAIDGKPVRMVAHYFPFWRWYVVGYIYQSDYAAPLNLARKVIFGGAMAVLLATIVTASLAFYLLVNKPLQRIIKASEKVAAGKFEKVGIVGKDEIGEVTQAFNSMVDSLETDQQKINAILSALGESEELYRVVTENSLSQILLMHRGRIIFANQRVYQDSGYNASELLNKKALRYIYPEDRATVRHMVRKRISGQRLSKPVECRYLTRSGDVRWLELAIIHTSYQGVKVILLNGTDITQRKAAFEEQQRLEAKLRQAQKMEAIGTLAGGIAHDFNNLLMGIQGNTSLIELDIPGNKINLERLESIQRYVKNGAELTRQLLGYARGGKYEVKPLDLNELVSQSSHLFGRTKKEIVIHQDLQSDIWVVEADRGQIEQVLLNLYVNSWQAMPNGGELFLKTKNIVINQAFEESINVRSGEYVCLVVTDTGEGMDEDTIHKIFDPFFTTKQRERGTGLGLASAFGIIKNHGGSITCKSKPNEGAIFSIYLPRSNKAPVKECVAPETFKSGSETILLVDDEEMVSEVGSEMLQCLGYNVLVANSGKDAISIVNEKSDTIDLVILDMIMPEMGGAETFEAIQQINDGIPVLLCSGYSLDGQATKIMEQGCDGFIQKPFNLDRLSRRVREILEHGENN